VVYKSLLLFGAPGSGKGTQGKILGTIPGFYHCACGDVFRAVDVRSDYGKAFIEYSSKGQLVPDDITIRVYEEESKPVLEFYGPKLTTRVNADQWPYQVLRDILADIEHYRKSPDE